VLQEIARSSEVRSTADFELGFLLLEVEVGKVIVSHEANDFTDVGKIKIRGGGSRLGSGLCDGRGGFLGGRFALGHVAEV
jgi:hypothetical protein